MSVLRNILLHLFSQKYFHLKDFTNITRLLLSIYGLKIKVVYMRLLIVPVLQYQTDLLQGDNKDDSILESD